MKTPTDRTSLTHPLQIAELRPFDGAGLVGLTLCPGKKQRTALTGTWNRDLQLDLDVIETWGAAVVVTLVEERELSQLQVSGLGQAIADRHIDWLHLPIRDRDVPDAGFEHAWREVGAGLRDRLRGGFNVLVHCMGGLGRAGTIASRLLIELGRSAGDAIAAVRTVRPGAIETAQQLEQVRRYSAVIERDPDRSAAAMTDRALGAVLGLAVGDALGTTLEFAKRDSRPRLTTIVGGGPFALEPGQWTDDTSMALALMDSLIACDGLDETDLMTRFVAWYEEGRYSCTGRCFDIGITTRQALSRFKASGNPIAGSTDPMNAGNGSLMRLAPVALRYWQDRPVLKNVAVRQSATTHAADEAIDACSVFAEMLADAIAGEGKTAVLTSGRQASTDAITAIANGSWRGKRRQEIKSSGYVVHSLEAAIWAVARTSSFADAVLLAANLGDDADTVAAITGQLAGAVYGAASIPEEWLEVLAWRDEIEAQARVLIERSLECGPETEKRT